MDTVIQRLDELAQLRAERAAMTSDLDGQITALTQQLGELTADIDAKISDAEDVIKELTIKHGATVKGGVLMAVWNKGRISWDTKGLEGYAVAHPEIGAFRKQGEPSVSIRGIR